MLRTTAPGSQHRREVGAVDHPVTVRIRAGVDATVGAPDRQDRGEIIAVHRATLFHVTRALTGVWDAVLILVRQRAAADLDRIGDAVGVAIRGEHADLEGERRTTLVCEREAGQGRKIERDGCPACPEVLLIGDECGDAVDS
ncbi:MAG: hypothetical protein ACK55I_15225, partial [bacterium]